MKTSIHYFRDGVALNYVPIYFLCVPADTSEVGKNIM